MRARMISPRTSTPTPTTTPTVSSTVSNQIIIGSKLETVNYSTPRFERINHLVKISTYDPLPSW